MTCRPILDRNSRRAGFLCVGNEPIELVYLARTYWVEWTESSGWIPVNKDGSERLSPLPPEVWDMVDKLPRPHSDE